jgi:hypothetical protein
MKLSCLQIVGPIGYRHPSEKKPEAKGNGLMSTSTMANFFGSSANKFLKEKKLYKITLYKMKIVVVRQKIPRSCGS